MRIVKKCSIHGDLTLDQVWTQKNGVGQPDAIRCKVCRMEAKLKNLYICKQHGNLNPDEITKRGTCRICHRASANTKRNNNRDWFNSKIAKDKINNPEKWDVIFKKDYQAKKLKYGSLLSLKKCCNARGITVEQYNEMLDKQNNTCAICQKPETCIDGRTKMPRRLSIDHCHKTNIVRGLLCHNCNVSIGKFEDDSVRIYRALRYIKTGGFK